MTILTPTSTVFRWLSHDGVNDRLTVGFRNQTSYQYSGVPEHVFALLSSSPSQGRYFNIEIRNRYPCKRVDFRDPPGCTGEPANSPFLS